jgi:hypothetical protein
MLNNKMTLLLHSLNCSSLLPCPLQKILKLNVPRLLSSEEGKVIPILYLIVLILAVDRIGGLSFAIALKQQLGYENFTVCFLSTPLIRLRSLTLHVLDIRERFGYRWYMESEFTSP